MQLTPQTIVKPVESIVSRQIGDDFLLVPMFASSDAVDCFYNLNQVGSDIWKLLDGVRTLGDIIDEMAEQYDAEKEMIENEVAAFLHDLLQAGIIAIVDDANN